MFKNSFDDLYLYHNDRCSKSREIKVFLDEKKLNYNIIDYLNKPIDKKFFEKMILKLENRPEDLIRVNEKIYKALNKNEKALTIENIPNLIIKHPILLQRPILVKLKNNEVIKSLICRPIELVKTF